MDAYLYNLHLEAGRKSGPQQTCGRKQRYETEEAARAGADAHNRWDKRHHDVEPYPCAFCGKWHIGKVMPIDVLEKIVKGEAP